MVMDRESAREYVKGRLEIYLWTEHGIDVGLHPNKAFKCLNPQHADTHPSMRYDKRRNIVHCFSCGKSYDIFDLIGIDYGLSDDRAIFEKAYQMYEIQISNTPQTPGAKTTVTRTASATVYTHEAAPSEPLDIKDAIEAAHAALLANATELQHFTARGITREIIDEYKIGFAEGGHNTILQAFPQYQTKSKKAYLYRYILPFIDENGEYTYFQSEISDRAQVDDNNGKYRKINNLPAPLFNERYLKRDTPPIIFITEGLYDAYSVEIVGGKAIALQGSGGARRLITICKNHKPKTTLILYTDADTAGQQYVQQITDALRDSDIPCVISKPKNGKDANEELIADKEAFAEHIRQIIAEAQETERQEEEEAKEAYLKSSAAESLQGFIDGIQASVDTEAIPTGFSKLDAELDGGLYEGLYTIGAITSLGKTTYAMQTADMIAQSGHDVLIFSLEMAKTELMAKSISRHTLTIALRESIDTRNAKTARGITDGKRYSNYSRAEQSLIKKAISEYAEYAEHIYINEGVGDIGVSQIRETIKQHIQYTGNRPIVIIDYLQILAPYSDRLSDKQNVDRAVLELKRISRDFKIPVLAISSFNRSSYSEAVTLEAFKESGAVEYSSDVLIGLQLQGAGKKDFDATAEKRRIPRRIEAVILKNRQGQVGEKLQYDYYQLFNCFVEA